MSRLDFELKVIDILDDACSNLSSQEFDKLLERIKEIVAEALNVEIDTLAAETSFKDDLGTDSLDLFEMVMTFEDEFGVEIPAEDLEQMVTIGDVEKYLEEHK